MQNLTDARRRDHFLGWQCRIRQFAVRQDGGRPSPGMKPKVFRADGTLLSAGLTVLMVPRQPAESTAFFKFNVQKSTDPRAVYEQGLDYMRGSFFGAPELFRDELAAVLQRGSPLAAALVKAKSCVLAFEQWSQTFRLIVKVRRMKPDEDAAASTLWQVRTFNPELPENVAVVGLAPEWKSAQASPEGN